LSGFESLIRTHSLALIGPGQGRGPRSPVSVASGSAAYLSAPAYLELAAL